MRYRNTIQAIARILQLAIYTAFSGTLLFATWVIMPEWAARQGAGWHLVYALLGLAASPIAIGAMFHQWRTNAPRQLPPDLQGFDGVDPTRSNAAQALAADYRMLREQLRREKNSRVASL